MAQGYLYFNCILYVIFALWCTVASKSTASGLGYLALSNGGRSEYLVIYGGLQTGLAIVFFIMARNTGYVRLGLLLSIALYAPMVIYRLATVVAYWPLPGMTLATAGLEALLLIGACGLYYASAS